MRKPKLSKIGVPVWAGSMVVVAPIVEKLDDARIVVIRKGRHIKSEYRANKQAAEEELEERRVRKAMEEIQPHIDAVEERFPYTEASFDQDVTEATRI